MVGELERGGCTVIVRGVMTPAGECRSAGVGGNVAGPVLVDLREVRSMSRDCRKYFALNNEASQSVRLSSAWLRLLVCSASSSTEICE